MNQHTSRFLSMPREGIGRALSGVAATLLIWVSAFYAERWLGIPRIEMGTLFRGIFLILFALDFAVTVVWSFAVKSPSVEKGKLKVEGPYRWVQYPLYSAVIFSGSGLVAFWYRSWFVILSVVVINFFWTWHVRREQDERVKNLGKEYKQYMRSTGQFFPKFDLFRHDNGSKNPGDP